MPLRSRQQRGVIGAAAMQHRFGKQHQSRYSAIESSPSGNIDQCRYDRGSSVVLLVLPPCNIDLASSTNRGTVIQSSHNIVATTINAAAIASNGSFGSRLSIRAATKRPIGAAIHRSQ